MTHREPRSVYLADLEDEVTALRAKVEALEARLAKVEKGGDAAGYPYAPFCLTSFGGVGGGAKLWDDGK